MKNAFERITSAAIKRKGIRLSAEECFTIFLDCGISEATACYLNAEEEDFDEDGNLS